MQTTLERELKLELDDGFELPELPGEPLESRIFTSTYYDTPVRSLTQVGITLRRRLENGVSRWQLKLPRGDTARAEIEMLGGPAGAPASLAGLLVAHQRHGELERVATLRTHRTGLRVADGGRHVADVTVDEVEVLDDARSAGTFAELEVELIDGGDDDLRRLSKVLRRAGARRSDGRPKLMRLLELPPAQRVEKGASVLEQLRVLLEEQLHEIEGHDPGVRLGDDPEDLHRYRVATRRARALIRATRTLLGDGLDELAAELKWLGGLLGPVRDLDVLIAHLRRRSAELEGDREAAGELIDTLEQKRARHRDKLIAGLDSARFDALLRRFDHDLAVLADLHGEPGADEIAADELRTLRSDANQLGDDPDDEQLHALRKQAKHARYAAELAALDGRKSVARYVDALKELQDTIGEHQDAVVAEERLRAVARGRTAMAAGRLIEFERGRRREARAAYPDVLDRALARGKRAFS